jgi:hypothetical protein
MQIKLASKKMKKQTNLLSGLSQEKKNLAAAMYLMGKSTEEVKNSICKNISTRSFQRYFKEIGIIRSHKESFILAVQNGRMTYDHLRVDKKAREKRKQISTGLRFKILSRDNHTCQYCGATVSDGAKLQIDHIQSVWEGGETKEDNLITSCLDCNIGKYHQKTANMGRLKS